MLRFRSTLFAICLSIPIVSYAQITPAASEGTAVSTSLQTPAPASADEAFHAPAASVSVPDAPVPTVMLPEAPRPQQPLNAAVPSTSPQSVEYPLVNGQPYRPPTHGELTRYYLHSVFGIPGQAAVLVRAVYGQAADTPNGWDQDWAGFGERVASNEGVTLINQSVKYGLSTAFHEDFRYYRCPGCSWKDKIDNILLAEVTARHGADGHRMPSITPIASHISGTVIAHHVWYPEQNDTVGDAVGSVALVLGTQVGIHIFEEFFLRHTAEKIPSKLDKYKKYLPGAVPPKPVTD